MELKLHSPVGAEPVTYPWPGTERLNTEDEIKATIKWVCTDFPDLKIPLEHNVLSKIEEAMDYESMKMLCDRFNRAVDTAAALRTNHSKTLASEDLLKHILLQVYVLSVTEPSELNQYEPFSPEVYGETSFDLISKMISLINITEEDTFIDLGSGIGQVVLQMAAATKCKECIGIEKADVPCRYADAMEIQFKKWMAWFGKSYGNYTLIKGDFLSEEHRNKITSSSIVFCNNYAFGPTVDHMLKERFADLKDGARIVSSKSFCSLNFRITDRNLSDIGTIMHVSEMEPLQGSVSWTGKPVSFYLHVIDRTKLERYFQKMKNQPRGRDTSANNSIYGSVENTDNESSRHVGSKNSDNTSDEESTDNGSPPRFSRVTTRRAWSDYVKSKSSGDEDSNYASSNSNRPKRILPRTSKSLAVTPANMPAAQKTTASRKKSAKGRRTKPKRPVKISGALDLLHNETLLSTSPEKVGRKPPPAPGCVDQQLTSITSLEGAVHEELEIPPAPAQTPYGLQILLNRMRDEMLAFIDKMKNPSYAQEIERLIEEERQKKNFILKQKAQLERQINFLTEDSVTHLKARVFEIGIYGDVTVDKIFKHARDIVLEHKKLQSACAKLSEHVMKLEEEQAKLVQERCNELRIQMGISGPLHKEHIMNELIRLTANKHKLMKHSATLSLQISNLEKHNEVMMKRLKEQVRLERPVVKASPVIQQTERKSDTEKHWQERRMPYAKEEPRIGFTANKVYESPRVANFEERLKNIITTALKEDTPPRSVISEMNKTSPTKSRMPTNQESPGKLALRRHLSQEKNTPPKIKPTPRPRTIGDLVNVEIERSFEKDYASTSKSHINPIIDTGHPVRGGNLMSHQSSGSGDPYEFPRFEVKEEPVEGLAASLHESLFSGEVKDELPDGKADKLKRAVSDEELFPSKRFELEGPSALSPAEGEKWKDKVSSSFDRIVAFASTVDTEKRRRSTEGGHMSSPDAEADGNGKGSRYSERDTPPVLEPLQGISPSPPPSSPLPLLPLDGPYSPVNKPQPTNSNHKHFKKFFQRNWKLQK